MEEEKRDISLANIFCGDERGLVMIARGALGTMPVISINARTLPEAWELAMLACWDFGARISTHYDKEESTPESKEATIIVRVENPFNEPRICIAGLPGGPEELESYRQEVVEGIHDHWINPAEGKWTYTYHERLFNYNPSTNLKGQNRGLLLPKGVNQIELIIEDLAVKDITSKGAQATTWMPTADPLLQSNRPCLQRLWFRALENENKNITLNLNSHWRSRDLYKAWWMNTYAITDLQKKVANILSEKLNQPVKIGSYIDISDSLHIYGDYFKEVGPEIEKMRNPDISKRVWSSDKEAFVFGTNYAKEKLAKDPDYYAKGGG